jgi:hypothetical protein
MVGLIGTQGWRLGRSTNLRQGQHNKRFGLERVNCFLVGCLCPKYRLKRIVSNVGSHRWDLGGEM